MAQSSDSNSRLGKWKLKWIILVFFCHSYFAPFSCLRNLPPSHFPSFGLGSANFEAIFGSLSPPAIARRSSARPGAVGKVKVISRSFKDQFQICQMKASIMMKKWPSEGRWYAPMCVTPGVTARAYLIFVISFTQAGFSNSKFYT